MIAKDGNDSVICNSVLLQLIDKRSDCGIGVVNALEVIPLCVVERTVFGDIERLEVLRQDERRM